MNTYVLDSEDTSLWVSETDAYGAWARSVRNLSGDCNPEVKVWLEACKAAVLAAERATERAWAATITREVGVEVIVANERRYHDTATTDEEDEEAVEWQEHLGAVSPVFPPPPACLRAD